MLLQKANRKFKVRSDRADWRDLLYTPVRAPLQDKVDMRTWASPVEDQLHLGSCIGQAIVGAYELLLKRQDPTKFVDLSRLFVYYNARLIEGVEDEDVGAYVRDGIKAVQKYGICSESVWPYNIGNFAITPSVSSYNDAKTRNIKNYYRLLGITDILDALNNNWPVVVGMNVFMQFEDLSSGECILKLPGPEESPIGGHAMCLVGYDLQRQLVLARNSFGADWCMGGYCWIPFDYVKSDVNDMWVFDIDLNT